MAGVHISIPTRLLDTCTGEFIMISSSSAPPPYAILSHVWNPDGEQSYTDIRELQDSVRHASQHGQDQVHGSSAHIETSSQPRISEKIRRACAVARAQGYRYIWIDSCCIDKTSSAELSEAINSMFTWYRNASICYAFLADVPSDQNPLVSDSDFSRSIWFTRGWTLQELLAPDAVVFLSRDWQVIGTKTALARAIARITNIPFTVLTLKTPLRDICVARRMSWASKRRTTRVEDEAYSLMGLFDINMPTLYGEGKRAFLRLQEEILRRIRDQTLFVWGIPAPIRYTAHASRGQFYSPHMRFEPFFAHSVAEFAWVSSDLDAITHDELASRLALPAAGLPFPGFTLSSYGVHARLPLIPIQTREGHGAHPAQMYLLVLACKRVADDSLVAVVCHTSQGAHTREQGFTLYGGGVTNGEGFGRVVVISPDDLSTMRDSVRLQNMCLDLGYFRKTFRWVPIPPARRQKIHIAPWSSESLRRGGYAVGRHSRMSPAGPCHSLILHNSNEYIKIEIDSWASTHELWLHDNTKVGYVDIRHLRLLTTVAVSYKDYTYTGWSEFGLPSGGSCICDVTITRSAEVGLWLLDIMLYYRDSPTSTSAMRRSNRTALAGPPRAHAQ